MSLKIYRKKKNIKDLKVVNIRRTFILDNNIFTSANFIDSIQKLEQVIIKFDIYPF